MVNLFLDNTSSQNESLDARMVKLEEEITEAHITELN